MIVVADTGVLVAELLRRRGRAPVALALALDVGILTGDDDFLGCGCPTWTIDTLRAELGET